MTHDRQVPKEIRIQIRQNLRQIVGAPGSKILNDQLTKLGYDPDTFEKVEAKKKVATAKKEKPKPSPDKTTAADNRKGEEATSSGEDNGSSEPVDNS